MELNLVKVKDELIDEVLIVQNQALLDELTELQKAKEELLKSIKKAKKPKKDRTYSESSDDDQTEAPAD